jgi:Abortive infection alpha
MSDDREPIIDAELVRNTPALARLAASAGWRLAKWSASAYVRTGVRLARAAADPVLAGEVVSEIGRELREYARDLLGINELDRRLDQLVGPAGEKPSHNGPSSGNGAVSDAVGLRVLGARLLRAAAEIEPDDRTHPAYARILTELAPDEGRILRLLATQGDQPAVDVRAANRIGVGSQMIASGLSMVGPEAGCQHRDRIPAYFNNLERLGLIWFSREPIGDTSAYQVLEAQPDVLAAIKRASRAKTVQRSISLTPFGRDFCEVCLPLATAEVEALADIDP